MKTYGILFVLVLMCNIIHSIEDDTLYIGINGKIVDADIAKEKIIYNRLSEKIFLIKHSKKNENQQWENLEYYEKITIKNSTLQIIENYYKDELSSSSKRTYKKVNDSLFYFTEYSGSNKIKTEYFAKDMIAKIKTGNYELYYPDSDITNLECEYNNNELISCTLFNNKGFTLAKNLFFEAEIMPKYNNNKDIQEYRIAVQTNAQYPIDAAERNIQGKVIAQFIVSIDGNIRFVNILQGVDKLLDDEVIRTIRSLNNWTPGYIGNKPVQILFTIPVIFSIK